MEPLLLPQSSMQNPYYPKPTYRTPAPCLHSPYPRPSLLQNPSYSRSSLHTEPLLVLSLRNPSYYDYPKCQVCRTQLLPQVYMQDPCPNLTPIPAQVCYRTPIPAQVYIQSPCPKSTEPLSSITTPCLQNPYLSLSKSATEPLSPPKSTYRALVACHKSTEPLVSLPQVCRTLTTSSLHTGTLACPMPAEPLSPPKSTTEPISPSKCETYRSPVPSLWNPYYYPKSAEPLPPQAYIQGP